MTGELDIRKVDRASDRLLRNLFEHYIYDMAEWFGFDTEEDGTFGYDTTSVWEQGDDVFIAYHGRTPIGFALIGDAASRVPGSTGHDVKEFFVVRRHRRDGFGRTFARYLWDQYPGPWLVRVFRQNLPAVPFWRSVIDEYTQGRFREGIHRSEDGREWLYFTFGNGNGDADPSASPGEMPSAAPAGDATPETCTGLEVVIDSLHPAALARFWAEALAGYAVRAYDERELARLAALGLTPETDTSVAVDGDGPTLWFQKTETPKADRNRIHLDVRCRDRRAEVVRLTALGARLRDEHAGHTVMLDPEGNEFCLIEGDG